MQSLEEQLAIFKSRYCEQHLQEVHADHIVLARSGCDLCNLYGWKIKYEKLEARVEELENPNAVNCDGLHASGSAPNTPHRPIGIIRTTPCPACKAVGALQECLRRIELGGSPSIIIESVKQTVEIAIDEVNKYD